MMAKSLHLSVANTIVVKFNDSKSSTLIGINLLKPSKHVLYPWHRHKLCTMSLSLLAFAVCCAVVHGRA